MVYDYIIIGAGPAGCFCATELKKKGRLVCICEKQEKGYHKVCGDGLAITGVQVLRMMDFPVQRFIEAGAVPIDRYYYYKEGSLHTKNVLSEGEEAYGLSRNITDRIFQEYVENDFSVPIFYGSSVKNIEKEGELFLVNGKKGKNIIIATGANAQITLERRQFLTIDREKPMGISMIVKGRKAPEKFFMFDYREEYAGTYAWIFTIGDDIYNVGLWLKEHPGNLKKWLAEFFESRAKEWIGDHCEIIKPVRGAYMGIGDAKICTEKNIYFAGDAKNTSNADDGEGISKAIVSAKMLIREIEGTDDVV